MKRMTLLVLGLMAALFVRAAEPADFPRRAYRVSSETVENLDRMADAIPEKERLPEEDGMERTWKTLFKELGVDWPEGSSVIYLKTTGELVAVNAEENLKKMDDLIEKLAPRFRQVEVDVRLLAASRAALESVGYFEFTRPSATNLYAKLRARKDVAIVSMPRLVTSSGQEAVVKGVTEYIYPTDYDVNAGADDGICCTNRCTRLPGSGVATVEPQSFTMREVGTILDVTPTLVADSNGEVELAMNLQHVGTPAWKDYGQTIPATKDRAEARLPMEQPFFPVVSVDAHAVLTSGTTEAFGGVTDGTEKGKDTFYIFFVTPRIIDVEGKEVKVK